MATGYLVSLGDGSLNAGDSISASKATFTIGRALGTGEWTWTGVWDADGATYSNFTDTGTYYVGSDGATYFVPDTRFIESGTASVTSAPTYTPDGVIDGTESADIIDTSFTDGDNEAVGDGAGNDVVRGNGGNDTITTGDGNDTLFGGRDDDSLYSGNDADVVYGGDGNDTIDAGTGADIAYGGAGNDSMVSGNGPDTFYGGSGNDTIDAGGTSDVVYGGTGNDTITDSGGTASADTIFGGAGDDNIDADQGDDVIAGGSGDDTIKGGDGADTVEGGAGDDDIQGGDGDDILIGDTDVTAVSSNKTMSWLGFGSAGTDTNGAVTQDTGGMTVSAQITDDGNASGMSISDALQFTNGGPFATNSGLLLTGGAGPTSTTEISFESGLDTGFSDDVENVSFRINDIDASA